MESKYKIGLVELYHDLLHGPSIHASGHYLVIDTFTNFFPALHPPFIDDMEDLVFDAFDDSTQEDNYEMVNLCVRIQQDHYRVLCQPGNIFRRTRHKTIRNYHYIASRAHYIQPQIIECFYLPIQEGQQGPRGEYVAVIKTFWLRLFQRQYRSILKERRRVEQGRMHPSSLRFREIHGRWPPGLCYLP